MTHSETNRQDPVAWVRKPARDGRVSQVLTLWTPSPPCLESIRRVNSAVGVQRKLGLWKWDPVPVRHRVVSREDK